MKTKLTAMVLALGAILGTFEAGAALAGSGTKAAPYRIGNYAELVAFAAKVNGGELSAWAVLTADITATGTAWTPIGIDYNHSYAGTFNGQGHKISNLNYASVEISNAGLFGIAESGAVVENVNLVAANIVGNGNVGGIVGLCVSGVVVENCIVSGSVCGVDSFVRVGGIVGGAGPNTVVRDCRANGNFSSTEEVGGIVGMSSGLIDNCEASGTVTGSYGGGIEGYVQEGGTIINCRSTCDITSKGKAGGIAAYCYKGFVISNCTASGIVYLQSEEGGDCAGGISGYSYQTTIKDCISTCTVEAEGYYTYVGGIGGRTYEGFVSNCSASGTLTGKRNTYVGGIIGQNERCDLENCSSSCVIADGYNVGGIAGANSRAIIRNCYNTGTVNTTTTNEYTAAGGIVGYNIKGSIENCYNTGAISCTMPKTGSLVGWNWGYEEEGVVESTKVTHSYAKAGVAGGKLIGETEGPSEVVGVRTLSAAEFTVKANFVGWDFVNVWKMGDTAPLLRKFYATIYDENWAGGKVTEKELSSDESILANAPADPKREGWYFCGWFTESEGGLKVTGATVADGDATYYAQWGKPVATFAAGAVSSSESKTVKLTVYGGSLTGPSSVKVFMTYQTAAAADLDFANATINGVKVKGGLKFPLTLSWDTGDVTPYVIEIPLKGDKTVEDDETVTFQLADVVGTEMGETDVCTVTVKDPSFDELRGRIETGTATKAESNTWTKASHDGIPYMRGLPYPADGGKATGSGYCPANKKVTLKATASKGFAFAGWTTNEDRSASAPYPEGYFVATTASLVIDRSAKPAANSKTSTTISNLTESTTFYAVFEGDPRVTATPVAFDETKGLFVASDGGKVTGAGRYAPGKKVTLKATANKGYAFGGWYDVNGKLRMENGKLVEGEKSDEPISLAASLTFEMGETDIDLYARFVTVEADKGSIEAGLNGGGLPAPSDGEPVSLATNVWAGVYLQWPVAADALSQTTVKVAGLPSGLKFTAKDIVDSKTKQVTVPANTIYGAPTAASKADGKGGVKPSDVKITVTTAGKSSITYLVKLTVDPLPAWAVGSFDGPVDGDAGTVSLTIAASGKISGKILEGGRTWTLSAGQFNHVEHVEQVGGSDVFYAAVVGKAGKEIVTNSVVVAAKDGMGVATSQLFNLSTLQPFNFSWTAWQNLWKRADTKASQPVFKKNIVVEYYPLGVSGDKNNTVKITFKKDGAVSFSGKKDGVSVSGSAQVVLIGRDGEGAPLYGITFYAPPKPKAKPPFEGWCETFDVKLTVDGQNIVTAVKLGGAEHAKVQLWEGGPYWATTNIGAEKPEDYGLYFWWGDTTGYKRENDQWVASDGSSSGFSFHGDNVQILTCGKDIATLLSEGWIINDGGTNVLAPEHDAAQVHWGSNWRMPNDQELTDLRHNCDWARTTMNGVDGYEVRGKGDYASNSIFLPCAGTGYGTLLDSAGSYCYYWSSVPNSGYSSWGIASNDDNAEYYFRYYGYSIRPVQSPAE